MPRNTTEDEFADACKQLRKDLQDAGIDDGHAAAGIGVSRPTLKRWSEKDHIPRQVVRDAYMDEIDRFRQGEFEELKKLKKVRGLTD